MRWLRVVDGGEVWGSNYLYWIYVSADGFMRIMNEILEFYLCDSHIAMILYLTLYNWAYR